MKLIVIGGVAAGASAAARARRLDEKAEIVMFERGEFISFANCGLPYHVGGSIPDRDHLIVMSPEKFSGRTAIDVRIRHEVTAINRERRTVSVRDLARETTFEEGYDRLIIATGARPIMPDLPGADDPDVMQLWTIPDMDRINARIDAGARHVTVVGGGFVGVEIAENLREREVATSLVELQDQVMPNLDVEMARPLAAELRDHGVQLHLSRRVSAIDRQAAASTGAARLTVRLSDGSSFDTDLVLMSVGVRPNSELAREAGLRISDRGGIVVDDRLRTSDPEIFAVGDAISVTDLVSGQPAQIPLAGPANRQGRIAADNALGRDSIYRGTLGTSIVKVFSLTAAGVGMTERRLTAAGRTFRKLYLHPFSHATYYPGASQLSIKLLFGDDGAILGAQAVGSDGVDKRIDVLATAMRAGLTVYDLEELELAYAPPYGSAKDPVNFAGMIAGNVLRGDSDLVHWDNLPADCVLLDVREPAEREAGHVPDSAFIPLGQLRDRLDELPRDRPIAVYCAVGLRGYLAERVLKQHGFRAANVSGGCRSRMLCPPTE